MKVRKSLYEHIETEKTTLKKFFNEDIGERDLPSDLIFADDTNREIIFLAKDEGVFCGAEIIKNGFQLLNRRTTIQVF